MKKITQIIKIITQYVKINYKIILLVLSVIGSFYWWQIRPSHIRSHCEIWMIGQVRDNRNYSNESVNFYYNYCLHANGL